MKWYILIGFALGIVATMIDHPKSNIRADLNAIVQKYDHRSQP